MPTSTSTMEKQPCILFTAFEPSGDEHAAPVIRELRVLLPDTPIYALGGPSMRAAGAALIEETTTGAAMLSGAIGKVAEHRRIRARLARWLLEHPVAVHVPTDSPAANWGVCRMVKRRWGPQGAKVVHLVAPQVWAWASWRVRRLRKWSDLVLCILPFEPEWFARHGVDAKFIGHPIFDEPLKSESTGERVKNFPEGSPRIVLLPGSRPGEVERNAPLMFTALAILQSRFPGSAVVVVAAHESLWGRISAALEFNRFAFPWAMSEEELERLPPRVVIATGEADAALRWADIVLAVSGTATLHVARHGKPMVIVYGVSPLLWHGLGRWLMNTRTFTLPNLIAAGGPTGDTSRHIVREFVPFTRGPSAVGPIVDELASLIDDEDKRRRQIEALERVVQTFHGHHAGREAAEAIANLLHAKPSTRNAAGTR